MNSQFSNMAVYKEEPFIQINPEDALKRGIINQEKVIIFNDRGSFALKAQVTLRVKKGEIRICFGWWKGVHKVNVNILTPDYISDIGYGATYNNCLVEVQRI